jgi:ubiquinone/menaquinone biosynthesis C-methylase UbiE
MVQDQRKNTYVNDTESGAEMARLLDQDRLITTCIGALWPDEQEHTDAIAHVLDIACGPGGWALQVGFKYPEIEVVGFDISRAMIEYASAQARIQGIQNARFEVMDATKPLQIPDASFDLVNGRLLSPFMPRQYWEPLLAECTRALRPGGRMVLTETDSWGKTNSPAFERLIDLAYKASALNGLGFDPSGHTFGITPMMERLLKRAGFQNIQRKSHVINFSVGTPAYRAMYENSKVFFKLVQPFLSRTRTAFDGTGIPEQAELDQLYEQLLVEMMQDEFVGLLYLLTAWGTKPETGTGG